MALYLPGTIVLAAILAWIGVLNAHNNEITAVTILVCLGVIVILFLARVRAKWYLLAALPWLFCAYARARISTPGHGDLSHFVHSSVMFRAEVEEAPAQVSSNLQVVMIRPKELFRPRHLALSGRAQLLLRGDSPQMTAGDIIEVRALLEGIKEPPNPWSFQLKKYLAEKGIFCQCTVTGESLRVFHSKSNNSFGTAYSIIIATVRSRIAALHERALGETYGSLLTSMVLGDKCIKVDKPLVDRFRNVGLSHLIAASGFNLTIVVAMSFWTVSLITRSRTARSIVAMLAIALFVALAGPSASVLRASICSCLFLVTSQLNRAMNPLAMLSLAMLLTIVIDPSSVIEPGAELSYAATFGLILAAKNLTKIADCFRKGETNNVFVKKTGAALYWLAETAAVAISAQASVLPIQLAYFWQIGAMFLPANIVVSPLVAPITVIGFISSALAALPVIETCGWLQTLFTWLDLIAFLPLKAINVSADYLAHIPNAILSYGPPSTLAIFFYYCCFLAALVLLAKPASYKLWSCFVLCAGVTVLLWRNELVAVEIDVGRECVSFVGTDRKCVCALANSSGITTTPSGVTTNPSGVMTTPSGVLTDKFAAYYGAVQHLHRLSENSSYKLMLKNGKENLGVEIITATQLNVGHYSIISPSSDSTASSRMLVITEFKTDPLRTKKITPFDYYHLWRNQQKGVRTYLLWAKPARYRPGASRQTHCFVIGQSKPSFSVHTEPGMEAYLYTD